MYPNYSKVVLIKKNLEHDSILKARTLRFRSYKPKAKNNHTN